MYFPAHAKAELFWNAFHWLKIFHGCSALLTSFAWTSVEFRACNPYCVEKSLKSHTPYLAGSLLTAVIVKKRTACFYFLMKLKAHAGWKNLYVTEQRASAPLGECEALAEFICSCPQHRHL